MTAERRTASMRRPNLEREMKTREEDGHPAISEFSALQECARLKEVNADLIAAINEVFPALEDAHDYISEAAGRHMRELGITTLKNKALSERMVSDLKNVEDTQTMLRAALARAQQS